MKILIIDDEEAIREHLKFLCERKGYTVFMVEDGQKAMEIIEKEEIKYVIADGNIPVPFNPPQELNLKIILISGDIESCRTSYEPIAKLQKPFKAKEIFELIEK